LSLYVLFPFSLETVRQGAATVRQELLPHPQRPFTSQGYGEFSLQNTCPRFHANPILGGYRNLLRESIKVLYG
jgi:hypothetical protein